MPDLRILDTALRDMTQRFIFRCSRDPALKAAFTADPKRTFNAYGIPIVVDIALCEDTDQVAHFVILYPEDSWNYFRASGYLSAPMTEYLNFCEAAFRDPALRAQISQNPRRFIEQLSGVEMSELSDKRIVAVFDTDNTKHLVVRWPYYESVESELIFEMMLRQSIVAGKTIAETGTGTGTVGSCCKFLDDKFLQASDLKS